MGATLAGATWAAQAIHPGFLWLKSFAEAALVGGLADWFAVTALFRHPLGLPIPHTAIIPRSRDRIGETLARFLRENFLVPPVLMRQVVPLDTARLIADFLSGAARAPGEAAALRQTTVRLMDELLATDAAAEIAARLKKGSLDQLARANVAPLLGRLLEAMLAEDRHVPLVDSLIASVARALRSQEGLVRDMVHERTAWLLTLVKVDERIADALLNGLYALLSDMAADPHHPVRRRAGRALVRLAWALRHAPKTQAKVEDLKRELLANPALSHWIDGLFHQARRSIERFAAEGGDALAASAARALRDEAGLRRAVNDITRRAILGVVARHGDAIVGLVSATIHKWDAATITDKLESAVLRDLQYIRFNGTLIGGAIGVALHAMLVLAGAG